MVLGKGLLFSIGNGAEIRPLEKGRKCPDLVSRPCDKYQHLMCWLMYLIVYNLISVKSSHLLNTSNE